MGFFGRLTGWDQTMAAVNAVMAIYVIQNSSPALRKRIAKEIVSSVSSFLRNRSTEQILQKLNNSSLVEQMQFVALACDDLAIEPIKGNVWTRVRNPYVAALGVDKNRINAAVYSIKKQDGVTVSWPGMDARVNFSRLYNDGLI